MHHDDNHVRLQVVELITTDRDRPTLPRFGFSLAAARPLLLPLLVCSHRSRARSFFGTREGTAARLLLLVMGRRIMNAILYFTID
jgi:hypothetical protein